MPPNDGQPTPNAAGIDMQAVCRTLARMLVRLDETGYTDDSYQLSETQQADVLKHTSLPDRASEDITRRAET